MEFQDCKLIGVTTSRVKFNKPSAKEDKIIEAIRIKYRAVEDVLTKEDILETFEAGGFPLSEDEIEGVKS